MKSSELTQKPMTPDTSAFKEHKILVDLFDCWMVARGDKMLPSKNDFEIAALDHPKVLPNLSLMESISSTEFRYRYIGSGAVQRRGEDQTRENVEQAFAPSAWQFIANWLRAILEKPHISLCRDRTQLQSGAIAENTALSVVLTSDEGLPKFVAVVFDADDAYRKELTKGDLLIGSHGFEVVPIDIGLGVPNLPRVVE